MNAPRIPMADHGSTAAGGPGLRANGDTQSGAQGQTPFLTCSMCTENFTNEQELEAHIQSSDPCSDCIHEALSKAECNGLRDEGQTQLTHASADENHSTSSMSPSSVKHESKTVGFAPKPFSDEPKSQGVPTVRTTTRKSLASLANLDYQRNVPFEDIDQVVQCLSEVDKAVRDYCLYVQKQQQSGKPLYKWAKCDEYKIIRRKAQDLSESLSKLQQYSSLPKDFTATLLEARRYSTSTSRAIGDVLAIINKKTESFVFEQQNFIMSEED